MRTMSYDECVTTICDTFDTLISPRKMARVNTNVIYLMFKAIAKGYEIVNNLCVNLSNKFDPASCSDEDLESVASIVGTERLLGSGSGLRILATNNGTETAVIIAGNYYYSLDENTRFTLNIQEDYPISAGQSVTFTAISDLVGSYHVTEQLSISLTPEVAENVLPSDLSFSCQDNSALLGEEDESNLAFRNRILSTSDRQDVITELQTKIRNLPYVFDCKIVFNTDVSPYVYDAYTIPSYTMLVMVSGILKPEIAEIIAEYGIYPTLQTESSTALQYNTPVFAQGYYTVNVNPFLKKEYQVAVTYEADNDFVSDSLVQSQIRTGLVTLMNTSIHKDNITEQMIYNAIDSLSISGIKILDVELYIDNVAQRYITVPKTRIPELTAVTFPYNEV